MRKKSVLLVGVGLVLLLGLVGTVAALARSNSLADALRESLLVLPQRAQPMTLAEARETIETYAQKWQPEAEIALLCSWDHPEDSPSSGQDGRRRAWQAILLDSTPPGAELWISLVDGSIVEETEQPSAWDLVPLIGRLTLDSPEALTRTLAAKPDFASADGKGKGVHFALEHSPTGSLAITVRGAHDSLPAIVSVDATTGEVLAARFLTFNSGGILYSSDAGQTWNASNLTGIMVNAIAADPLTEHQAYAATTQDNQIAVYQTQDGGKTWSLTSSLPPAAGDWPFSLEAIAGPSQTTRLFVGTASGLWSWAGGREWSLVRGLPDGPKQWLAVVQSETAYRLFVSITAGKHRGLYASTDLSSWVKLADSIYRLSESFDQKTVLATDEQQAHRALLLSIDSETEIEIAEPVLHAAGDFKGAAPMILHSPPSGVGRSFRQAEKWTLSAPVASLAAAPDFPTSHVAIAGGFRTGIYRTTDAGQTWYQVLADPSSVLQGNDEIVGVTFLSPTTVIAVNGGEQIWQDF